NDMTKLTLVIVVHNIKSRSSEILGMTKRCLDTLRETADVPYEIILMDNGSRDDNQCFDFLVEESKRFTSANVLASPTNQAIAACWNWAIDQAEGDIIVLLNNDVVFNKQGWLSEL